MYSYQAKITRIIDGDSFEAEVDLGFYATMRLRFRLMGYNAPEIRGREQPMGQVAMQAITSKLTESVLIVTHKGDSFGRWLADVILGDGSNLAISLISEGYGVPWDGRGKRPEFDPTVPYPLGR